MNRCHKQDNSAKTIGCIREALHRGICKVRANPGHPQPPPPDWPCAGVEGCKRRVKSEGARCHSCRMLGTRHTRPAADRPPAGGQAADGVPAAPPMRPAAADERAVQAPTCACGATVSRPGGRCMKCAGLARRGRPPSSTPGPAPAALAASGHIEALTVSDVIANKAARKVLCGLARAILHLFEPPAAAGRRS